VVSVLGGTGTALIVACLLTLLAVLVEVTNDAAEAATLDPSRLTPAARGTHIMAIQRFALASPGACYLT
jgi:hypothetical protein